MPYTIAHLADLHLGQRWLQHQSDDGINLREHDTYRALEVVTGFLVERKPDLVVIAGDLFDSQNPSNLARMEAFRAIVRLRDAGMPVVVIGGNHDAGKTHQLGPLALLGEFFDTMVYHEQATLDLEKEGFGPVRLHLLPYASISDQCEGRKELQPLDYAHDRPNVLVAHAYAHGQNVSSPPELVVVPDAILHDPRLRLILLGHIHQHIRLDEGGNAFYSGMLERRNFGEADAEPGFHLHTLLEDGGVETESKTLASLGAPGVPRPMISLRLAQDGKTPAEIEDLVSRQLRRIAEAGALEGSILRIVISQADEQLRSSAVVSSWQRLFRELGGLHLEPHMIASESGVIVDADVSLLPGRLDDALIEYLKIQDREDLLSVARELFEEAEL